MSEEVAKFAVTVLAKNFKRNFPSKGMTDIWPELIQQSAKAIELAVDNICLNSSYLPSPAQFLEKVKNEAKLIAAKTAVDREEEWSRTKGGKTRQELERSGSIFSAEQSDAHGRHALQAIRLMFSNASRADKLECFRVMDQQYPGVGWALEGMRMQKEMARQDKRPHWRDVVEASPQFQHRHRTEQEKKGLV